MSQDMELDACIGELFRTANLLHGIINTLEGKAKCLQELSMNAAIISGQCGAQARVFAEIARQIGNIASGISECAFDAREVIGSVNGKVLASLVVSGHYEKYLVIAQISQEALGPVEKVRTGYLSEISSLLCEAEVRLECLQVSRNRLQVLNERVWSTALNLRTVSSQAEYPGQSFFPSIATSLEGVHEYTSEALADWDKVVATVDRKLAEKCDGREEVLNAA